MNVLVLVWRFLRVKPLSTALHILLLALGIGVVVMLILFQTQFNQTIRAHTQGIDLVVGAKGSPLQLILCNVFHADLPTGNIGLSEAEKIAMDPLIKRAIPLALGDNFQGYRMVGTTQAYPQLYQAEIDNGRWWQADFEVVFGANVSKASGLGVGAQFLSAHGLSDAGHAHDIFDFQVVGVMKSTGTALDNLVLTTIPSIWMMHESHDEKDHHDTMIPESDQHVSLLVPYSNRADTTLSITSMLLQYRNPIAAMRLPRTINAETNLQAASPAFEVSRLFALLGFGKNVLIGFSIVLMVISGLSIFIGLYNSLQERQYDLAMMRVMGSHQWRVFAVILLEGLAITAIALLIGMLLGHMGMQLATQAFSHNQKINFSAFTFYRDEAWVLLGGLALGLLCSLVPAVKAYRLNIHHVLAQS